MPTERQLESSMRFLKMVQKIDPLFISYIGVSRDAFQRLFRADILPETRVTQTRFYRKMASIFKHTSYGSAGKPSLADIIQEHRPFEYDKYCANLQQGLMESEHIGGHNYQVAYVVFSRRQKTRRLGYYAFTGGDIG